MGVVRIEDDTVVVSLTPEERGVLTAMATDVASLISPPQDGSADPLESLVGMSSTPVAAPDDPVVLRLLPDALEDPDEAAEFRRLTDDELRRQKNEAIDVLVADLAGADPVKLPEEKAGAWVQALNDVRLALGTRLGVTEDGAERAGLKPDDPRQALFVAYDWLTWLQGSIVEALMGELD